MSHNNILGRTTVLFGVLFVLLCSAVAAAPSNANITGILYAPQICLSGVCQSSWPGGVSGAGAAGNVSVWTGSGTLGNTTMYYSAGSIGIGTSAPGKTLDVRGAMLVNSSAPDGSFQVVNTSGRTHVFINGTSGAIGLRTSDAAYPVTLNGTTAVRDGTLYVLSGATTAHAFYNTSNAVLAYTTGSVSIGTVQFNQKLNVDGNGNFSGTNAQVWVNGSLVCTVANGLCGAGSTPYQSSAAGWTNTSQFTNTNYRLNVTSGVLWTDGNISIGNNASGGDGISIVNGTAIGAGAWVLGNNTIAIGTYAGAEDVYDSAGKSTIALGALSYSSDGGIAIGYSTDVEPYGISIGHDATSFNGAISVGQLAYAAGSQGIGIGYNASADSGGLGIGYNTKANSLGSMAIGPYTRADYKYATVIGSGPNETHYLHNNAERSMIIGFNTSVPILFLNNSALGLGTRIPRATLTINSSSAGGSLLIYNQTNASNLFVSGASGYVGVGTLNPTAALTVNGSSTAGSLLVYNRSGATQVFVNGVTGAVGIGTQGPLSTFSVNSSAMNGSFRVQNTSGNIHLFVNGTNGRVGIGTNAPVQLLQLGNLTSTSTSTPVAITLGGTYSDAGGKNLKLILYDDGTYRNGIGQSLNQQDYVVNATTSDHVFYALTTPLLIIKGNGLVGIGTAIPNTTFHVYGNKTEVAIGNLSNSGNMYLATYYSTSPGIISGLASINSNLYLNTTGSWNLRNSSSEGWHLAMNNRNDSYGEWGVYHSNKSTVALTSYFSINSLGDVGIGSNAPTAKLQVVGTTEFAQNTTYIAPSTNQVTCFERVAGTGWNYSRCINSSGAVIERVGSFTL